jgi:nucleoside-diphosphate-sugar epimerase
MQEFNPGTPYAATKLLGERYVEFFSRHHGLDAVIVRYFNTYGPGELPGRYRNVIPNFFYSAMKSQELRITGSGEETRDFNFVEDTVAGTIRASEIASSGAVYNIGSGRETTILTVATRINQIVGNPAGIEFVEERKWDTVPRRLASIERAVSELGYRPAVGIDEGLQKTYEWLKEQDLASCSL